MDAIPRRRVLGGMVLGAAGTLAGAPLTRSRALARALSGRPVLSGTAGKAVALTASGVTALTALNDRGPDGFLRYSIGGSVATVSASSLVVLAGPNQTPVPIILNSSTKVLAVGDIRFGDATLDKGGDRVVATTGWTPTGQRVASLVEINSATYWATVQQVGGSVLTCLTSSHGSDPNSVVQLTLIPKTNVANRLPQVGQAIYAVANKSTPVAASKIWVTFLEAFGSASFLT